MGMQRHVGSDGGLEEKWLLWMWLEGQASYTCYNVKSFFLWVFTIRIKCKSYECAGAADSRLHIQYQPHGGSIKTTAGGSVPIWG